MKKILLFFILFFLSFWISNSNNECDTEFWCPWDYDKAVEQAAIKDKGDLTSPGFQINVNDVSPWIKSEWTTTKDRVNWILGTIIQKMMIALWSLSILIMAFWTWYIILHNWQDEILSKWKSIFMSGVYAMILALSSYYLISIIRFLLYWNV